MKTIGVLFMSPLVLLPVACDPTADARSGANPTPAYTPLTPHLRTVIASAPSPPESRQMQELQDLIRTAFGSGDVRLRGRAKRALNDSDSTPWVLRWALDQEPAAIRSNAAYELANRNDAPSIPLLLRRFQSEKEPEVRLYLADALARLGNLSSLPTLTEATRDAALAERAGLMAIHILTSNGEPPGEQPSYEFLRNRLERLHGLWIATGRAPVSLHEDPPPLLRAHVARLLLDLEEFQLRQVDGARFVLSRMGRTAVPMLRRCLLASETYLRQHSMEILRRIGPAAQDAGTELGTLLTDPAIRAEATRTIGFVRANKAAAAVATLLQDPDLEVRCAAAGALGPLGDGRFAPTLKRILDDSKQPDDLRIQAAFSLALLDRDRGGLEFLLERRAKGDYHVPTINELLDRIADRR